MKRAHTMIATVAALYVAKLVAIDVGWRERHSSSTTSLVVCAAIGAAIVALPLALGGGLVRAGHPGWALAVAIGSLVVSGVGVFFIASAARP